MRLLLKLGSSQRNLPVIVKQQSLHSLSLVIRHPFSGFGVRPPKSIGYGNHYTTFPVAPGRRHERVQKGPSAKAFPVAGHSDAPIAFSIGLSTPIVPSPRFSAIAYVLAYYNTLVCSARAMLVEGRLVLTIDIHYGLARL